jgi:hypothetical protein
LSNYVSKYNLTGASPVLMGKYIYNSDLGSNYLRLYITSDVVIAGANNLRAFNKTSFQYINTLLISSPYRGYYIQNRNLFIISSAIGQLFIYTGGNLYSSPVLLTNINFSGLVYMQFNKDESKMVVTDSGTNIVRIFETTNWNVIFTYITNTVGNRDALWTSNGKYLIVSSYS